MNYPSYGPGQGQFQQMNPSYHQFYAGEVGIPQTTPAQYPPTPCQPIPQQYMPTSGFQPPPVQPHPGSYTGSYGQMPGVSQPRPIEYEILKMQHSPTVKCDTTAIALKDVFILKKAFDGIGCDTKVLKDIITRRSLQQIAEICKEYEGQFSKLLWKRLRDELWDPHRYLMIILVLPPLVSDAFMLNRASTGSNIDVDTVAYVLASRTDAEIAKIKEEHHKMYSKNIRDCLYSYSSGWCQSAWMTLLEMRNTNEIDIEIAHRQASMLYAPGKITEDLAKHMISVFCKSSHKSCLKILKEYEKLAGRKLYDTFAPSAPFERTLSLVVLFIEDPAKFYSTFLNEAITNNKPEQVVNVIGNRCQFDLGHISSAYATHYKSDLKDDIKRAFNKSQLLMSEVMIALMGY